MASKPNDFSVSIKSDTVVYTNFSTSKDGYNSARIVAKSGEKAYLSVSMEWEDSIIPDFVFDMMTFVKNSGMENSGICEGKEKDYAEFSKIVDK